MSWTIEQDGFQPDEIERNGNRFLLANGYLGYRGTLEEFGSAEFTACILAGVYDRVGDAWREPINAPNGLKVCLSFRNAGIDGQLERLSVLTSRLDAHSQTLDIKSAVHGRTTTFAIASGTRIKVSASRFVSAHNVHLSALDYTFESSAAGQIVIETGIDGDVWDLSGKHLRDARPHFSGQVGVYAGSTIEQNLPIIVAEAVDCAFEAVEERSVYGASLIRRITVDVRPGTRYCLRKYVAIYSGKDNVADPEAEAVALCMSSAKAGYSALLAEHAARWHRRWVASDVQINGDEQAQLALRYSIYHLLAIAPTHGEFSIPARGLSAQTYKGAIFWDTEIFMLPFFLATNPDLARNLMMYRVHTLDGARRKAAEYGYRGAFYAWESQDTGDDACTHHAFNDVFTGRPIRTYFRDKQVHISADIAFAIDEYVTATGDESLWIEGGADVVIECARFFYSYAYCKPEKKRWEILDVTGPDEYHERVNNNAYTNRMVRKTLDIALTVADLLDSKYPEHFSDLVDRLDCAKDLAGFVRMRDELYVPQADPQTMVIEQFDRYHKLEEATVAEVKGRMINPAEYLGGANGVASGTQVIKQADTVLALHLFREEFSMEVKAGNWRHYEPRTEHGSSLSPCVYALVAADIGDAEWGYKYFMKTAGIDLAGEAKHSVGGIYLGGTHPAANGGAWMAAVLGFGGLRYNAGVVAIEPCLPRHWQALAYNLAHLGQEFRIEIDNSDEALAVCVRSAEANTKTVDFRIGGQVFAIEPGSTFVGRR